MQLLVSRDYDQLLTDIEGAEYELPHGEITDSDIERISKEAFAFASSHYNLPAIFMEAVLDTCKYMRLLPVDALPVGNSEFPRVHGDGHGHYVEWDGVIQYMVSEYGLHLDLSPENAEKFQKIFDHCIDGACWYSDLIDNAMLDTAVELGYARNPEDDYDEETDEDNDVA